jgi:23S rRNA (cytidine1920-2'-O)/16S rRNA (cytidine1409-2'-O)-methyltransferase
VVKGKTTLLRLLMSRFAELDEREARGLILRGHVLSGTQVLCKPGLAVAADLPLRLRARRRFASRGGDKLEAALERWGIDVAGKTLVDAGSSTGGFADCLLGRGAALVYCVDVGRAQLAWRLRTDSRIRVLEGHNAMHLGPGDLEQTPHGAVCDVSFRSIRGLAAHLVSLVSEHWLVALVKPQFEYRSSDDAFRGVVASARRHVSILSELASALEREGLAVRRVCPSPMRGPKGNREFFFYITAGGGGPAADVLAELEAAVAEGIP